MFGRATLAVPGRHVALARGVLGAAVTMVFVVGLLIGFLLLAICPLIGQATQFAARAPEYLERSELLHRFQAKERLEGAFRSTSVLEKVIGAIVPIPIAASLLFVFREFVVPRLDRA